MVSCGQDNIRLWRIRNGVLRSCPVDLGEYQSMDFTDVAFEEGDTSKHCVDDQTLWVRKPFLSSRLNLLRHLQLYMLFTCPAAQPIKRLIILSWIVFHRFASSRSGYILEIDYSRVVIRNIRRLMPAQQQANCREKCTTKTGDLLKKNVSKGILINTKKNI